MDMVECANGWFWGVLLSKAIGLCVAYLQSSYFPSCVFILLFPGWLYDECTCICASPQLGGSYCIEW